MKVIIIIETYDLNFILKELQEKNCKIIIWDYCNLLQTEKFNEKCYIIKKDYLTSEILNDDEDILFLSTLIENPRNTIENFLEKRLQDKEIYKNYQVIIPFSNAYIGGNINILKNIEYQRIFFDKCIETKIFKEKAIYIRAKYWSFSSSNLILNNIYDLFRYLQNSNVIGSISLEWYIDYKNQIDKIHNSKLSKISFLLYMISLMNYRHTIMYIIHADFHPNASNNIGGTQFHVRDLVNYFKYNTNVLVLTKDNKYLRLTLYQDNKQYSICFPFNEEEIDIDFYSTKYANFFCFLMDFFKVELLHIHHTKGLTLCMYDIAAERNIPIYLTLHDYYYICPKIKLSCNNTKPNLEECDICLNSKERKNILEWHAESVRVMNLCSEIFVPSESAKRIFLNYFPLIKNKLKIVEHGLEEKIFIKEKINSFKETEEFNIAFIGGLSPKKGSKLILGLLKENISYPIKWFIFGGIGDKDLEQYKKANLVKYGWYKQEDITSLLHENKINLVCILSTWAETYCYTLTEALIARIPVLVSEFGALGERVKKMQCGWIVPQDKLNEKDIRIIIENIINNKDSYQKVCDKINNLKLPSLREMNNIYSKIYFNKLATINPIYQDIEKYFWDFCTSKIKIDEGDDKCPQIISSKKIKLKKVLKKIYSICGWKILNLLRCFRDHVFK